MNNSDLVFLLQKIPAKQRSALRKFIFSPFFNLREDVSLLFMFLMERIDSDLAAITFENAHQTVYPQEPYNTQQIRYVMSYLTKVIEQYLVFRETRTDPVRQQINLAAAYRKIGLEKPTRRSIERANTQHQKSEHSGIGFYENKYLLETEQYLYAEGMKRTAPRNLQQVNQSLDRSYLAKKLKQSSLALSHGAVANIAYDTGLLELILGYLENAPWLDEHPAIALYFYYYRAATTENNQYFDKLKNGLLKTGHLLSNEELRAVHLLAINFGIQRFNKGEVSYLYEVFDLYKSALKQDILLENGRMSRFAFKNIAGIAIRLGAFDWTSTFIETYNSSIEHRHRRNYTDYNLAKLHYAKKDFDKAMHLLQKVEYEDVFLNLDAKVLLLKIYFEINEMEVLDNFIHSFQRFLQRKKGLGYHRENYLNTLQFARRLISINPFDKKEKETLKMEIETTKALGEKEWLLDRMRSI